MQSLTQCVNGTIATASNADHSSRVYVATICHGENSTCGLLPLDARTDAQAIAELRDFVGQGYRNETSASVDLADGRHYHAQNKHGRVVGHYV